MDWEAKYKENQFWINQYMAYMQSKSLSTANALKIMTEIGRLNSYNTWIENMHVEDYMMPVEIINITQESKL